MELKRILVGVKYEHIEVVKDWLTKHYAGQGVVVDVVSSVPEVFRALENSTYNALIVQEHISVQRTFNIQDFDRLTDEYTSLVIVPLLSDDQRGSGFVKKLYGMGIYSALFGEVGLEDAVKLISEPRGKQTARAIYGIAAGTKEGDFGSTSTSGLTAEGIKNLAKKMNDMTDDVALTEYFTDLCSAYDDSEIRMIIASLSEHSINILDGNETFGKYYKKEEARVEVKEQVVVKKVTEVKVVTNVPEDYKKVIGVLGFEKGVGVTTLAVKMARYYAAKGLKVALIDLDKEYYDCFNRLDLQNAGKNMALMTEEGFKDFERIGEQVGMTTVYSDFHRNVFKEIDDNAVLKLIQFAKKQNQVVIVDIDASVQIDMRRKVNDLMDETVLVVEQDFGAIERLSMHLNLYSMSHLDYAINRFNEGIFSLSEKNIGNVLFNEGVEFNRSFKLPYDEAIRVEQAKRNTLYKDKAERTYDLAVANLCDYYYMAKKKKGLFSWLKN